MTFVELVEQQRADAIERGIVLQHAGQDAFGDNLDPRASGHPILEADAVTHRPAHRFAELLCHEARGRACGDPARLQHQDLACAKPVRPQQRQRHLGGLACAGRRFQHQACVRGK